MWTFHRDKKNLQNGHPTVLLGLRENRHGMVLKTRIIRVQTSFHLRQFLAGLKVEISF